MKEGILYIIIFTELPFDRFPVTSLFLSRITPRIALRIASCSYGDTALVSVVQNGLLQSTAGVDPGHSTFFNS